MSIPNRIKELGEVRLIRIIDDIIYSKYRKHLLEDDAFYYELSRKLRSKKLVFNSDMFVSSTDAPKQMSYFQMGHKSVIMNISDLLVKGVKPKAIIISIGIPSDLEITNFKNLIKGIVECCYEMEIEYIGGDLNLTTEIVINPTVFGFKDADKIIYRKGLNVGDLVLISEKFGLTGVGFEILLKEKEIEKLKYPLSIKSVLEPIVNGSVARILSNLNLATSSIDSSDGLSKSLKDLMYVNPNYGFEINLNDKWVHSEAKEFSKQNKVNLSRLVFDGGEEFIHIFTIKSESYKKVSNVLRKAGLTFYIIGVVINEEKIYINHQNGKFELNFNGFEHFS